MSHISNLFCCITLLYNVCQKADAGVIITVIHNVLLL